MSDSDLTEGYDWGGDGTELFRPVRAHVEAALLQVNEPYPAALEPLLQRGEPTDDDWVDSSPLLEQLGITAEHVPALVRMARDRRLLAELPQDDQGIWAPYHALNLLRALGPGEVVADIIPLLDLQDDYLLEELPALFSAAGAPAVPLLRAYLHNQSRWFYGRASAGTALARLAHDHPDLRSEAGAALTSLLETESNPELNGFVIADLIGQELAEFLPAIRAAYARDAVDLSITGDYATVLERLGQSPDPADPLIAAALAERAAQPRRDAASVRAQVDRAPGSQASKREKNKRKQARVSRKANKRKKKR